MSYQVIYMDRRGAGRIFCYPAVDETIKKLKSLCSQKLKAVVRLQGSTEEEGATFCHLDGKWCWYLWDRQMCGEQHE